MTDAGAPSRDDVDALFAEYAQTRRRADRNRLVEAHVGFASHVARRYEKRGVEADDLRQVAFLALVKAVERFDPGREVAFTSFAGRTIEGELKRHFRDKTWDVRVPRSAKELHLRVRKTTDELGKSLGRSPSVREVAAHLDIAVDDVVEALTVAQAYSTASLDAPAPAGMPQVTRAETLARPDDPMGVADDELEVERLITRLPEREQEIVRLRFYDGLTQSEIAERVDLSQMHVSRLLRRALTAMRAASPGVATEQVSSDGDDSSVT